jgi:hypothetical protein
MSCIHEDGGAIDVKVTGYVVGEDGSVGLRCTLVTKSGQVIANSLMTGIMAGFGYGLQATGQQQNTTVNGAVTTTTTIRGRRDGPGRRPGVPGHIALLPAPERKVVPGSRVQQRSSSRHRLFSRHDIRLKGRGQDRSTQLTQPSFTKRTES